MDDVHHGALFQGGVFPREARFPSPVEARRPEARCSPSPSLLDEILSHGGFPIPAYISPSVVATSMAGVFLENLTYARFSPLALRNVLTCSTDALNIFSMACLTCCLVAWSSMAKMSLFSDSMSLMDFSVDIGCLMMLYSSTVVTRTVFPW